MVMMSSVALLAYMIGSLMHRSTIDWIPESLLVVVLGFVRGGGLWLTPAFGHTDYLNEDQIGVMFSFLLKLVALPIIIFESGWSLRLRDFVSQLGYIMLFAILGTVVSVIVVGSLILLTQEYHGINKPRTAFAYASLISSVDPVATLSTFGRLNVDPLLFILVFGESQINDAVAITLFESLNKHELGSYTELTVGMLTLLFGSIGLGLLLGTIYLLILRFLHMGHAPHQAIMFIFVSCFFTYSFAECLKMSGIITVLFNSILMGTFAPAHLSTEAAALASFLLKQAASLADTSIFIMCGVMVVFVINSGGWGVEFGFMAAAFCMVGRFAAIVPLALISNVIKKLVARRLEAEKKHKISWKHLFMMWHSGLRGGVSLVLALELGDWVDNDDNGGEGTKSKLVNATFILIVLYLGVFGGTTGICLRCLGLPLGDQVQDGVSLYNDEDRDGPAWRGLMKARRHVLVPLLVGRQCEEVDGHALGDVLREATRAEHQPNFGHKTSLHRHQSVKFAKELHDVYDLFGTTDPAHVDAIEDIMNDLRGPADAEEEESDDFYDTSGDDNL
jgi:NhaP-type Na+/H+ or K+/H+ antiporter